MTPEKASQDSIPRTSNAGDLKARRISLANLEPQELKVLTIYTYRNPFNGSRYTIFNVFSSDGTSVYQSKPFEFDSTSSLFEEIKNKVDSRDKLLVIMSFWDTGVEDKIIDCIKDAANLFL